MYLCLVVGSPILLNVEAYFDPLQIRLAALICIMLPAALGYEILLVISMSQTYWLTNKVPL